MPRAAIFLVVVLAAIVLAMVALASIDTRRAPSGVQKAMLNEARAK